MWKDFFYFTKGQRIGIVVLLVLIVIIYAACYFYPYPVPETNLSDKKFTDEARCFEQGLVLRDSIRHAQWDSAFRQQYNKPEYIHKQAEKYTLFSFDPNKADSATFVKLGLKYYVASNILKFRAKGGVFRTAESFSKVYGITPEKFKELEPYIAIEAVKPIAKDTVIKATGLNKQRNIVVELNTADTTELMQVYGIGRGYAKAIVRFRQQAGGYVSVEQLRELYGMTDAAYTKISPSCRVDISKVRKINVNTASVERLNAHPYLNFYEAKAIYEYRRRKGRLQSVDELRQLPELSPQTLARISGYFTFE